MPIPSSCWMQRIPSTVGVEGAHGLSRKGEKDVVLQAGESSRMSFLLAVEQKVGDELEVQELLATTADPPAGGCLRVKTPTEGWAPSDDISSRPKAALHRT